VGFEELYSALSNNYNISNITELNSYCNRCPSLVLNSLALYGTLVSVTSDVVFFTTQLLCVQDNNGNYCSTEELDKFTDYVLDTLGSSGFNDVEFNNFLCNNQCAASATVTTWLGQFAFPLTTPIELWAEYKSELCYMKGTLNEIIVEIH
jgi:hypothetical protein